MERDLTVVYRILEKVESCPYNANDPSPIPVILPGVAPAVVQYHCRLLDDAGFIETLSGKDGQIAPTRLTWQGHDYLDRASNIVIDAVDNLFAEAP